jgi:hypothetical protein
MNIARDQAYSVIHWRAELPGIDYMACAQKILLARDAIQMKHQQQHPFILMSSLNTQADYMWAGAKELAANTSSDLALQLLLNQGFMKLDQVVDYDNLSDPIMLAVYDLVLALHANNFATCSKDCSDHSICSKCNWRGQFAGLAVAMRRDVANKTSISCWPDTA